MIIITKETLREAVSGLRVLKLNKQPMPACQRVLVHGFESVVQFDGTDLDQYLRYEGSGTATTATRVLVPCELLATVAKQADATGEIRISDGDEPCVIYPVSGAMITAPFTRIDVAEFPAKPMASGEPMRLPPGVIDSMREALTCASSDTSRYILNSVFLDAHAVVATDGRQLYRRNSLELPIGETGAIFPLSGVLGVLPDAEPTLHIWDDHNRRYAQIVSGPWRWITKLADGNFPNYAQVIPKLESYGVTVRLGDEDAKRLGSVVPKLPGFKDENSVIVLSVVPGKGAVIRTSPKHPKVQVALDRSEVMCFAPVEIGFNARYLLGALGNGLRELHVRDSLSPLVLTNGSRLQMWMPCKLTDASTQPAPATTPSDPSVETLSPVVPTSEPQPTNENTNPSTTMVASNTTTPGTDNGTRSSRTSTAPVQPGTVVDAVNTHLNRLRDLLREANGELGNIQTLVKEQQRSHKALERDHESLKKNIRALREVPV